MDKYQSKGLRLLAAAGGVLLILSQAVFGTTYYSFGKKVNQSFGPANTKSWTSAEIFVPASGNILNLDLALNIEHTSFCNLQIYIDSPQGTTACINYYDRDNFVKDRKCLGWMVLDEESLFGIDQAQDLYMGLFKPNGPDRLSMFYGQQSLGKWTVRIYDAVYGDTGILRDVRIDMAIAPKLSTAIFIPEPSTIFLAAASVVFLLKTQRRQINC